MTRHRVLALSFGLSIAVTVRTPAQTAVTATAHDSVRAIAAPREPIPREEQSAGRTRFSFIVYGDTRGSEDGVELQAEHGAVVRVMLDTIAKRRSSGDPIRFILQSGDAVVDGRNAAQWNVSFVGLIDRLTTEGGIPYFLAPGNHDVTGAMVLNAPGREAGLANYLQAVARLIPPDGATRRLRGYPTYAFGYGNTFVIAFDSNIADDSTQFAWVSSQLDGLDRRRYTNVVAFFHHPVFSSGPHGGPRVEPQTAALRAMWMPLMRKHHVRLLFAGHDHLYEHWVEHYRDASGSHRIDQIVSGGGGAPPYYYAGEPELSAYVSNAASDSVRVEHIVRPGATPDDNPYHFVVMHVDGEKISMEVIGVGKEFHPYSSRRVSLADSASR